MNDKIVIITGANSGIGREAAFLFAQSGYTVVMGCRNIDKSLPVRDEIANISNNENVFVKQVDTSSFSSIRKFCESFKNEFPKLDILIHNAAYFSHGDPYFLSEDNVEIAFATNVAGPFLMTNLLSEHLRKADDARVLNASSSIIKHFFSPKKALDFENLQGLKYGQKKQTVYLRYCNSKMAFLMLTFRMAKAYSQHGITVNSFQINGAKMSKNTLKKFKFPWIIIAHIENLFFKPPAYMAERYFELCTSERFAGVSGKHFNNHLEAMLPGPKKPTPKDIWGSVYYPPYADREDIAEKVWENCINFTSV